MELEKSAVEDALGRLRRVEGQVGGIIRMVDDGRDCRDILTQISAASKALDQVGFKLLASGLRYCVTNEEDAAKAGYTVAELERLFLKLA
ncbi:metal-sensitive transcriptional regulator [soil metagenome]